MNKSFAKKFLTFFLPPFLLLSMTFWVIFREDRKNSLKVVQIEEKSLVEIKSRLVTDIFQHLLTDLVYLAENFDLKDYIRTPSLKKRRRLENVFRSFAYAKGYFDQVRYLNNSGKEVVRLNYYGGMTEIVPAKKLQNKSHRPYFQQISALDKNEIYISPLALNVEDEKIEMPIKPVLRLAIPIIGPNRDRQGSLILNFMAVGLINEFIRNSASAMGLAELLNADGYWLIAQDQEKEWGFIFPERGEKRFQNFYPGVASRIFNLRDGQIFDKAGLVTFANVYPLASFSAGENKNKIHGALGIHRIRENNYHWKIISIVPSARLNLATRQLLKFLLPVYIVLSVIVLYIARFYALSKAGLEVLVRERTDELVSTNVLLKAEITEHREAEEAFKNSESRTKSILETTHEGFWLLDNDFMIKEINSALCKILDRDKKNIIGKPIFEFMDTTNQGILNAEREQLLKGEQGIHEIEFQRPDGTLIPCLKSATSLFNENKEKIGSFAMITDLSQIKKAQEAAVELSQAVEHSSNAIVITDAIGRIQYANSYFFNMTGYSLDEVLNQNPRFLKSGVHPDGYYKALWSKISQGKVWRGIICNKKKNGELYWEYMSIAPVKNSKGIITKYIAIKEDITEKRRMEEENRKKTEKRIQFQNIIVKLYQSYFQNIDEALNEITESGTKVMERGLASIWLFNENKTEFICQNLFDKKRHQKGIVIHPKDFPAYFEILKKEKQIVADDALGHEATRDFRQSYLGPMGITSMMDTPIWSKGEICGVLCIQSTGQMRSWTDEEKEFAFNLANLVSMAYEVHERRETEIRLSASEGKFRTIFRNSGGGTALLDMNKGFLETNDEMSRILGFRAAEFDGMEITKIVPLEELIHFNLFFHRSFSNNESYSRFDMPFLHKDGHLVWADTNVTLIRNENQQPQFYILQITDISKHKLLEEELRNTTSELQAIVQALPDIYFIIDKHGNFLNYYASDQAYLLLSPDNFLGRNIMDIFEPDLGNIFYNAIAGIASDKKLEIIEYFLTAGNTQENFEARIVPLVAGKVMAVVRNITQRKKMEKDISESLARLKKYNEFLMGREKVIIELKGTINGLLKEIGRTEEYKTLDGFPEKAEEFMNLSQSAATFDQMAASLQINPNSETLAEQLGRRIEELKESEWVILNLMEDAEREKQKAEQANQAKSQFLANMSHEIRTPMNAILGFTELLKTKITDPEYSDYLLAIETSGKSLLRLINDILDLSKIEAGKLELQYSSVSLPKIIRELTQIFSQKIKEKNIDFLVEISDEMPDYLVIDETRLRQILLNLIGNAIKFTDRGYVKVSASAQYPDKQNPAFALVITIEDTGIGIPKDGGESVFASFEQLGREKNTQYGGTGLGLSITKRLVQMMNGQIYLRDKFGPGALFEVIIRNIQVASADLDQTAIKNISLSREEEQAVLFDPANILIADDVPYNRELLKGFLLKYNFTFFEAADGREALRILEMEKIDLILMDIKMPELDGKEAAEFIRGNLKTKDIPMIAITASAMKESEEKLKNIFDAYLTKPIGTTILLQGLKKFIPFTKLSVWDRKNDKRKIFTGRLEPKIIANLPQLIAEILEKLNPTWEQLRKSVKFRQAKEFAHAVGSLADEYKVSFLKDWSTGLEKEINSFNKEKIQNFLETFGLLISELKIMSRKKNK